MILAAGRTITPRTELAVLVPSLTVTVMGATPMRPEAGVTETVRLLPLPPKATIVWNEGGISRTTGQDQARGGSFSVTDRECQWRSGGVDQRICGWDCRNYGRGVGRQNSDG